MVWEADWLSLIGCFVTEDSEIVYLSRACPVSSADCWVSFPLLRSPRRKRSQRAEALRDFKPLLVFLLKLSFYINPPDGNHPEVDLSLPLIRTWKPSRLCSLCPFQSMIVLFFTPSSLFLECPERAGILKNTGPPSTPHAGVVTAYWSAV